MIILETTNESLEFLLGGTVGATQLPFVAFWVDHTATAYTPGSTHGVSNNTTAVTAVAAPAASTQRTVKYLNFYNADNTIAVVTVRLNDGGTTRIVVKITLAVSDTLQYTDTDGWSVIDTFGQKKSLASVVGNTAHDAVVAGNPLLNGFEARTTDGTPVGNGDAVRALADTLGKQVTLVGAVHDLQANGKGTFTDTTAADLIAAAGAGVRIAVMSILVTNHHATVNTKVEIRDGTTVKIQGSAFAVGGGFSLNGGGVPLFISTANTAVTGRCVTTGSDTDIFVSGYKIAN